MQRSYFICVINVFIPHFSMKDLLFQVGVSEKIREECQDSVIKEHRYSAVKSPHNWNSSAVNLALSFWQPNKKADTVNYAVPIFMKK